MEKISNFLKWIISPEIMILVSIVILFLYSRKKNNNYFNISQIFIEQFSLFENCKGQLIVFYGVPFILALAVVQIKILDTDVISNMNVVLSIFTSMFFAMLSIISSYPKKDDAVYNSLMKETYNSLIFEIVLCILTLMTTFLFMFINVAIYNRIAKVGSFLVYFLTFVILLNIFIIIKRIKVLHDNK